MSRSAFLTIAAVIAILYSLGFILAPGALIEAHGVAPGAGANLFAQGFGSALLGLGVMAWLARNATDSPGLTAILRGATVYLVINLVVVLIAIADGAMNAMGWVPAVVDALLAIGFAYFGFVKTTA